MTNEKMFERNIGLAYKIASRYMINYLWEFEDIKQVALIGLWKAVLTFKNTYTFSTYACTVISNEINHYLRTKRKEKQEISINTMINDEGLTIEDTLQGKDNIDEELDNIGISISIEKAHLSNREKEVYDLLKKGYNQPKIAKMLDISKQRVSQIRIQIMKKIRKKMEEK